MRFVFCLTLILSSISFGGTIKLSKDEFLKRTLSGDFNFQKNPLFPLPLEVHNALMEKYKGLYPSFKSAYWFVPTVRSNEFVYTLFYDWVNRKCLYRVEEIDINTKQSKKESIDVNGTSVDIKYCEKAYGIKI